MSPEEAIEIVAGALAGPLAAELADRRIVGVGVAVPGLVRASDHVVRWAPHLQWRDVPFGDQLGSRLGIPCAVGNDATLGARAEQLFGAGRGIDDLVYLNGGASGIGGGVITGGAVVSGRQGYAGEFGQNRPGATGEDRLTVDGVLEDEVNRSRLLEVLGLPIAADESTLEAALLASRDPGGAPRDRAPAADPRGRPRERRQRPQPDAPRPRRVPRVAPRGRRDGPLLVVARTSLEASWEGTRLTAAALGGARLLIGAAELAFAPLLADPAANG